MPYKDPAQQRACAKKHYHANKAVYQARAGAFRRLFKRDVKGFVNWLKEQPCMDCHAAYHPCVMDFDHVRGVKSFNISAIGNANSWHSPDRLWAEIEKCEVVCANCHRIRTHVTRKAP